jgi:serine/threonine protein kinase
MCARDDSRSISPISADTVLQGRYRIIRQVGRGGMGAVYEATDLRLGNTVAVKQALTNDAQIRKHFEREARLLAQLNHPGLPRVSDFFTEDDRAFLVMQFVDGDDLATLLAQNRGPLPRHTVVMWADQLLDAIIYLHTHDRQIIHRDIKPHNLKVTASGKIALLDFGLAKSQSSENSETHGNSLHGYSPRYAPLEQIHDTSTSPQNDIYALGATLYQLLTAAQPADAVTRVTALITAQPNPLPPAHEINPAVGVELSAILSRAMAHDASARYRTAKDFRDALRKLGRVESFAVDDDAYCDIEIVNSATSRLRSRAMAALFVILLASFGVFCHYYRWQIPPIQTSLPVDSNRDVPIVPSHESPTNVTRLSPQPADRRARTANRKTKKR